MLENLLQVRNSMLPLPLPLPLPLLLPLPLPLLLPLLLLLLLLLLLPLLFLLHLWRNAFQYEAQLSWHETAQRFISNTHK
jgi:hypothetical protein